MTKKIFHYVERVIVLALMAMMLLVVALSTVELAVTLIKEIMPSGEEAVATGSDVQNGDPEIGPTTPVSAEFGDGGDDDAYNNPALFLDIDELLTYFGLFFMILIGLELLETIKMYLAEDQIHVEVVMLVAIIAVCRKVILLDLNYIEPMAVIGLALIIVSLGGSYFLVRRAHPHSQHTIPQLGRSSARSESR